MRYVIVKAFVIEKWMVSFMVLLQDLVKGGARGGWNLKDRKDTSIIWRN